jgi:hypothetical protein
VLKPKSLYSRQCAVAVQLKCIEKLAATFAQLFYCYCACRATFYGTDEKVEAAHVACGEPAGQFGIIAQGSCGYTNSDGSLPFPREMYAANADTNVDYPGSCGRCYEVRDALLGKGLVEPGACNLHAMEQHACRQLMNGRHCGAHSGVLLGTLCLHASHLVVLARTNAITQPCKHAGPEPSCWRCAS